MTWGKLILTAAPTLLVILSISYIADGYKAIPSGLVAWGTILLAYTTFSLIKQSREQEAKRQKAEIEKEERDRDERILNEVIQWAIDTASCRVTRDITKFIELQLVFEAADIKSEYIINATRHLKSSLQEAIAKLTAALKIHVSLIDELSGMEDDDERSAQVGKIKTHNTELEDRCKVVIKEATTAKLAILP